jgi:hypothetical protein
MRTEQDLHTALSRREDLAPDTDAVLAGARVAATGYRRRRAATTAGAAAAAALAVAAVVILPGVIGGGTPADPAAPPPADPLVFEPVDPAAPRPPYSLTIYPNTIAGFEINPTNVGLGRQIAEIVRVGEAEPAASLYVYDVGTSADIGGLSEPSPGPEEPPPGLRWEYVPGGTAEIVNDYGPALDAETMQLLADGLQFTAPYPIRLPYWLEYLPAGWTPLNVIQATAHPGTFRSLIQLDPNAVSIAVGMSGIDEYPDQDWQPTTIAGRPAQCADLGDGRRCVLDIDGLTVSMGFDPPMEAEVARILDGMHPADWDDPTTWYEIDDALPGQ